MSRDKKKKVQETLSTIDGVLAALNSYPSLEDALLERAQNESNKFLGKLFPTQLDFIKNILEHVGGTDMIIDILSKFLTVALPGVEVSLKAALLANMQNFGTNCEIDPIIYEKAIKEGIIFDLKQIDLIDKLSVSPLDRKLGKYFYFGIDGCGSAYDILQSAIDPSNERQDKPSRKNRTKQTSKKSTSYLNRAMNDSVGHYFGGRKRDFDCLLWYMKNKAAYREVWGKRTSAKEDIFNGDSNIEGWIAKNGDKYSIYYKINPDRVTFYGNNIPSSDGNITPMNESKIYRFIEGKGKIYQYKFGDPPIKKISRDMVYYTTDKKKDDHGKVKVVIYGYADGKWGRIEKDVNSYKSVENISPETPPEKDDFILVDGSLFVVEKAPKFKEKTIYDKNDIDSVTNKPKEKKIKVVSDIKTKECINITNDLKNNVCVFVDYDDVVDGKKKGDLIKEGKDVSSSLDENNVGQRHWIKKKWKDGDPFTDDFTKKGAYTTVYYEKKSKNNTFERGIDKVLIPPHVVNKDGVATPFININDEMEKKNKYTKDFGILTLDFSPRTGNVLQSDGKPMQQQTPYGNVLHVFFGNVKEIPSSERMSLNDALRNSADSNRLGASISHKMEKLVDKHLKIFRKKIKEWKKSGEPNGPLIERFKEREKNLYNRALSAYSILADGKVDNKQKIIKSTHLSSDSELYSDNEKLMSKLYEIDEIINSYDEELYQEDTLDHVNFKEFNEKMNQAIGNYAICAYTERASQIMEANENLLYLSAKDLKYPEARKNYYYKHTLFEFNADYINSLQLFDPKVLAAQLITSLFGGLTMSAMIGATASWKTELIHDVIKNMIEKVIASEDMVVSDCFFTFTNDTYNGMLRASELRQAGLYSKHGEQNGNNNIDPVKLLEGLNEMDNAADQAGHTEIIKGAITNAAVEVSKDVYTEDNHLAINTNFGIKMSFMETLMINLCTQCVMTMLSPKVYLLILINLEMYGLSTNFDIKSFIERFGNLIRSIVKSVVDKFMEFLHDELMKIIEELIQKLITKISFEQVEMYVRLLKQILMHIRMFFSSSRGQSIGWSQDIVGYADIISADSQEPINEC
jgi:hypothetical protein|nr:MAG TPA: hypothetical protein [Ackermannviridae sp.]